MNVDISVKVFSSDIYEGISYTESHDRERSLFILKWLAFIRLAFIRLAIYSVPVSVY